MRFLAVVLSIALWLPSIGLANMAPQGLPTVPSPEVGTPDLKNPGFECSQGYHDQEGINGMVPDGWTALLPNKANPKVCSTQVLFSGDAKCDPNDMGYEKLEGSDSYVMLGGWNGVGQDFLSPPFDVAVYQQVAVEAGTDYSVSGWLTSLCGGSASPNDCPPGYYISKQVGMDPTGGTDPLAPSVQWMEDLRPHTTAKWVDLSVGAKSQGITLTVFVRVNSPFQHHGNHAFADAVKLVRAPHAYLGSLPAQTKGRTLPLTWSGDMGPDIPLIPKQQYHLYYDLEYREGADGSWQSWGMDPSANSTVFFAGGQGQDLEYYFRLRARAEQPDGAQNAAYPNHRFRGAWTEAGPVRFGPDLPDRAHLYLPAVLH